MTRIIKINSCKECPNLKTQYCKDSGLPLVVKCLIMTTDSVSHDLLEYPGYVELKNELKDSVHHKCPLEEL